MVLLARIKLPCLFKSQWYGMNPITIQLRAVMSSNFLLHCLNSVQEQVFLSLYKILMCDHLNDSRLLKKYFSVVLFLKKVLKK